MEKAEPATLSPYRDTGVQALMANDRAFVLSPEFVRLFRLAYFEGLFPALLRAAGLDLPPEIPPPESKAWRPPGPGCLPASG
jgi:hypothetical protein